jgi:hypothetical protein
MPQADQEEKLGFTSRWEKVRRQVCLDYLKCLTRGNPEKTEKAERQLMLLLKEVLVEISEERKG